MNLLLYLNERSFGFRFLGSPNFLDLGCSDSEQRVTITSAIYAADLNFPEKKKAQRGLKKKKKN